MLLIEKCVQKMSRMLELFSVCIVLATTQSAPWIENNNLKEFDLEWQCNQLCNRLSGRSFYTEDNSTCSCLVDEDDSDMNWNRIKHNARTLGLMLDIINTNSKKILKRETPAERFKSLLAGRFRKPDVSDSNNGQSAPEGPKHEEKPPVELQQPEQNNISGENKLVEPKIEENAPEPVKIFPKLSFPPRLKNLFLEKNSIVAQANPVIEEPPEVKPKKEELIVQPIEESPISPEDESKKASSVKEKLAKLKKKMELYHKQNKDTTEVPSTGPPTNPIPPEPHDLGAVLKAANEKHASAQERREAVRAYLKNKFEHLKAKNHAHHIDTPPSVLSNH